MLREGDGRFTLLIYVSGKTVLSSSQTIWASPHGGRSTPDCVDGFSPLLFLRSWRLRAR